jgi:type VI secretion system secreted protein VgrG
MSNRLLELKQTSLFGNEATITELVGREVLSRPFEFHLTIASPKERISPEDVIGQSMSVRIDSGKDPRWIHGYVSHFWMGEFSATKKGKPSRSYRVRLVPWLWFATRSTRSNVYLPDKEKKSIKEILEVAFGHVKKYGHVQASYSMDKASILSSRQVEHCVQYRETDYNFIARTLEKYGVYYYFEHTENSHKLILSDQGQYPSAADSEVEFPINNPGELRHDTIVRWEHAYEMVSGKSEQKDYNFTTPLTTLTGKGEKRSPLKNNSGYELYDYPGDYSTIAEGEEIASRRLQEEEVRYDSVNGQSTCRSFAPGYGFKLTKHASCKDENNKHYLLTSVNHHAAQPGGPHSDQGSRTYYLNDFVCVPRSVQFRPERSTQEPFLPSLQTAKVVGPDGEEIHVDKWGRVKVRFHWDREPDAQENHSCWIRVGQIHAGGNYGGIHIPRIGEEVIVSFIEGDPDRPLITGRVYNDNLMPPFELPKHKTRSGIRSKTYRDTGFNEIIFEDMTDKEILFVQAQKDMDTRVLNDCATRIFGNEFHIVGWEKNGEKGGDVREMIYQDKHVLVHRHHTEHVQGCMQILVGAGEAQDGGDLDIFIEKKKTETIGGDSHLMIQGNHAEKVSGNNSSSAGGNHFVKAGGNIAQESGPMGEIHLKGGMKVIVEAGMQLSLVGPGGFIDIGPSGINIQGILVNINSGGAKGNGSGCKPQQPKVAKKAKPSKPKVARSSKD